MGPGWRGQGFAKGGGVSLGAGWHDRTPPGSFVFSRMDKCMESERRMAETTGAVHVRTALRVSWPVWSVGWTSGWSRVGGKYLWPKEQEGLLAANTCTSQPIPLLPSHSILSNKPKRPIIISNCAQLYKHVHIPTHTSFTI